MPTDIRMSFPGHHQRPDWPTSDSSQNTRLPLSAKLLVAGLVTFVASFILVAWCFVIYYVCRISTFRSSATTTAVAAIPATSVASPSNAGLDAEALASLPTFAYSAMTHEEKQECVVCLAEFKDGEKGRLLPGCLHRFHAECVDLWFRDHSTCPLCRSLVEASVPELSV